MISVFIADFIKSSQQYFPSILITLFAFCSIHIVPTISQSCYPQNICPGGYMDRTNGNYYWWSCGRTRPGSDGKNCPGSDVNAGYTDGGCNCACIPATTCQPTASPTNPSVPPTNPSANPSQTPSDIPTGYPSQDPSVSPTADPSNDPSTDPSVSPTTDPSTQPDAHPNADVDVKRKTRDGNESKDGDVPVSLLSLSMREILVISAFVLGCCGLVMCAYWRQSTLKVEIALQMEQLKQANLKVNKESDGNRLIHMQSSSMNVAPLAFGGMININVSAFKQPQVNTGSTTDNGEAGELAETDAPGLPAESRGTDDEYDAEELFDNVVPVVASGETVTNDGGVTSRGGDEDNNTVVASGGDKDIANVSKV